MPDSFVRDGVSHLSALHGAEWFACISYKLFGYEMTDRCTVSMFSLSDDHFGIPVHNLLI